MSKLEFFYFDCGIHLFSMGADCLTISSANSSFVVAISCGGVLGRFFSLRSRRHRVLECRRRQTWNTVRCETCLSDGAKR